MRKLCIIWVSKNAPSEDFDQTAQADLNLRWAHMSEHMFSKSEAQIMMCNKHIFYFCKCRYIVRYVFSYADVTESCIEAACGLPATDFFIRMFEYLKCGSKGIIEYTINYV